MTIDAQAALRRIIEAYSTTTRFCIICNYISKIIDPLASRCVKFRFSPIGVDAQKKRLLNICKTEGVKLKAESVLDSLIKVTEGDLRRSINTLQTCSTFAKETGLSEADIESISGIVPHNVIQHTDMVVSTKGATYSDIQKHTENLIFEGYDCQQLLHQLLDFYNVNPKVADIKKAKIAEIIAQTDYNFTTNGNEELNLLHTLSSITQVLHSK